MPALSQALVAAFGMAMLLFLPGARAATLHYDLQTDWSNSNNANGAWRYLQGTSLLPFQAIFSGCFNTTPGLGGGWAPSSAAGNCLPAFLQATGTANDPADFHTGDIVVHSVDNANGNPVNGEAIVSWTAPANGVVSFSGDIWYAHSIVARSNDFLLVLDGTTTLASGTIAFNSAVGNSRTNMDTFSGSGFSVVAGDVLSLSVSRTSGQAFGSADGIDLSVTELTSVPEPGTFLLFAVAVGLRSFVRRRQPA